MGYTLEIIKTLAEQQKRLNELSAEEKKEFATRLVMDCPPAKLKSFRSVVESARDLNSGEPSLYSLLSEAYEVKNRIYALLDPRNKNPHSLLIGSEFNLDLFNNYRDLASEVLSTIERDIAMRLAETTPEKNRNQVAINVNRAFPDTLFAAKVAQAFVLKRDIDRLLLGSEPYKFFTSRDYNLDSCHEFPKLFAITREKETSIATQLALTTPPDLIGSIARNMQTLVPGHKELAEKVNAAFMLKNNIQLLLGERPEAFFSSRDFSLGLCHEFAPLFSVYLKGHEQSIGEKLSSLEASKLSEICHKLEQINGKAHDQTNPFRLIAEAIKPKQQSMEPQTSSAYSSECQPASSVAENPHLMFQSGLRRRGSEPTAPQPILDYDSDSDAKSDTCFNRMCGLFK
ncbi:hypothetical protein [Legionella worsleiensis]|uniref:Uncharacterized protein n=1 Tax=Legionella worsleiensis TaxID=45076 RepID=A0A0W1AEC2_9GAMM|nr:hypothetical protein [Legionella worsleiensis]KTD79673.1 hypothetical protein Lwor_1187 [Legionella worsleiensis]STY32183.1 Uncharacterised protein [Legionella worsleiensis]